MCSELRGCWRMLRDDLRPSENTREREREGWGWVGTSCVLSQDSQANLGELGSESTEDRRKRESLQRNSNYDRAEWTGDTIRETKPRLQMMEENLDRQVLRAREESKTRDVISRDG